MMIIAWNNGLEFKKLFEHHPFKKEGPHVEHLLINIFNKGLCEWLSAQWNPQDIGMNP
jgi:hypothetical protein